MMGKIKAYVRMEFTFSTQAGSCSLLQGASKEELGTDNASLANSSLQFVISRIVGSHETLGFARHFLSLLGGQCVVRLYCQLPPLAHSGADKQLWSTILTCLNGRVGVSTMVRFYAIFHNLSVVTKISLFNYPLRCGKKWRKGRATTCRPNANKTCPVKLVFIQGIQTNE